MKSWKLGLGLLGALLAAAAASALTMARIDGFPAPASGAYGVTAAPLPDGRFLLWNGGTVFVQTAAGSTVYDPVATGYAGDPGFAAVSPDGHTVILGAGYSGDLLEFDVAAPVDYTPAAVVGNQAHFAGTFLNSTLLLLDAGKPDFSGSELAIFDISGAKSAPVTVVRKSSRYALPKSAIVDKPPYSYSAVLTVDTARGIVYAMDGNTRELRTFSVQALIDAHAAQTALDWETDGALVGQAGLYYTGGACGITADGRIVIGGSEGYLLPGGIQLVRPDTGAVTATLDPTGEGSFYSAAFSPGAQTILALVDGAWQGEAYAVDLDAPANGGTDYSTGGFYEVGANICLQIPDAAALNIQWYHDGVALANASFREFCIQNAQISDSGEYRAIYEDGSKATSEYVVRITVAENVPAAGGGALAALALLTACAACLRIRRAAQLTH